MNAAGRRDKFPMAFNLMTLVSFLQYGPADRFIVPNVSDGQKGFVALEGSREFQTTVFVVLHWRA
jgi:hypothetical protein